MCWAVFKSTGPVESSIEIGRVRRGQKHFFLPDPREEYLTPTMCYGFDFFPFSSPKVKLEKICDDEQFLLKGN